MNRDISSAVYLDNTAQISETMTSRARNSARKASKSGVIVVRRGELSDFWVVMEKTFQKLGIRPAHTLQEFHALSERFPEDIYVDIAYLDQRPIAGIGYFVINERVNSSFYFCQDPEFQNRHALSLLVSEALFDSQHSGFKWFDFGTSSVSMRGKENLFRFKESFGAVGLFRETYLWKADDGGV